MLSNVDTGEDQWHRRPGSLSHSGGGRPVYLPNQCSNAPLNVRLAGMRCWSEIDEVLQSFALQSESDMDPCFFHQPGVEPGSQLDLDEVRLEWALPVVAWQLHRASPRCSRCRGVGSHAGAPSSRSWWGGSIAHGCSIKPGSWYRGGGGDLLLSCCPGRAALAPSELPTSLLFPAISWVETCPGLALSRLLEYTFLAWLCPEAAGR